MKTLCNIFCIVLKIAYTIKPMKNSYTITIESPENTTSSMYSAHCKEWGFVAEDNTPEKALIGLLDAIRIAEESKNKKQRPFISDVTFQIPAFS
jgi:hypothetical protein